MRVERLRSGVRVNQSVPPINKDSSLSRSISQPEDRWSHLDVEEIYSKPSAFFKDLIKAIDNARARIYITNITIADYNKDEISRKLVDHLIRAKRRGVDVKVRLDEVGVAYNHGWNSVERLRQAGIPVYIQDTLSLKRLLEGHSFVVTEHRKVFVVDDKAYVGGVCLSDLWYKDKYRDVMISLRGEVVNSIVKEISKGWPQQKFLILREPKGHIATKLFNTSDGDLSLKNTMLKLISQAKESIYVENQYLVDEDVVQELAKASERGVKVVVVLPKHKDDAVNQYLYIPISKILAEHLVDSGAEVWRYKDRLLHTKLMVIDGRYVIVGSHNLDYLSTERNIEASLLIDSPELAERMIHHIQDSIRASEPETRLTGLPRLWAKVAKFLVEHSPAGKLS